MTNNLEERNKRKIYLTGKKEGREKRQAAKKGNNRNSDKLLRTKEQEKGNRSE